jgi:opacity protein-like surface antigen
MKRLGLITLLLVMSSSAFAEGQVFYRYGISRLSNDRGGQIFTDVGGASGRNDDKSGKGFGAGLDLKMMDCPLLEGNSIIGEIFVDYNRFSNRTVVNAIDVVAGNGALKKEVAVSELAVVVAPKYRFDSFGKFRPWIIPAGMAFLVNSPPSNTTNYLDIGYHAGVGAEYVIVKAISLGVDYRYTMGSGDPQLKVKYSSFGANLGINF